MTAPIFRGAAFVEHIRTRLWDGGASGRATVMIGAGFSRNAQPSSPSAPRFPLLEDYRAALAEHLNLGASVAAHLPLERLASEYEASFGRETLNDAITRLIPWRQYHPGPLHQLLLELPWADVFTTNYDPLLEDTRALVHGRKYDLVLNPDDIPTASPPRIVKLHGSFPSMRPFIFTEEDFRSYPRRFAPFVNLVQQGMMEHTLCLLGFSGDDPNFLRWAGWVRDELGPHRPRIYLVGVLDLQDGRRRYLEQLGITPVDLAELFPWRADQDSGRRHQQATEWFLRSLANGEPPDLRRWPGGAVRPQPHGLPHEPLPSRSPHVMPERDEDGQRTLSGAYRQARALRLAYPGWEVCPVEKRETLHLTSRGWFGRVLIEEAVEQEAPLDLLIAREGVWQLALAGEPLTPTGVKALDTILTRTDPSTPPDGDSNVVLPKEFSPSDKGEVLPWLEVKAAWVEAAFAQLVEAREDVHEERFLKWEEALRGIVQGHPDWEARRDWEGVRWAITILDREGALQRLRRWPEQHNDPFWEGRRAAALAEVGEIEAARDLNQRTLNRVRAAQVPGQADYRLLSQEGWLMVQARLIGIERYEEWEAEVAANDRRIGRLSTLRQYDCDPWEDLTRLKTQAAEAFLKLNAQQESLSEEREFDAGWVKRVRVIGGSATGRDAKPALRLLRLPEWAAYPLRVGSVTFGAGELTPVIVPLLRGAAPRLGALTAVRAGAGDALKVSLSRDTVANMVPEDASTLIGLLLNALSQAGEEAERARERIRYGEHHFSYQVLQHGLEALSRLMLHADPEQRRAAVELAIRLAGVHAIQWDSNFYEPLGHLLRRGVGVMSNEEKLDVLPNLAAFPIPAGNISLGERWPDPFSEQHFSVQLPADLAPLPADVPQRLLAQAGATSSFERHTALVRLAALFRLGFLNPEHQQAFAQTLWRDRDDQGLPRDTPFYRFAFLKLPHPPGVEPDTLLKARYLEGGAFQPVAEDAQEVNLGKADPQARMRNDLISLREAPLPWTPEDIRRLLDRLQAWWPGMIRAWELLPEDWVDRGAATPLLDVLREVLLPHAGTHREAVGAFIHEVAQYFQTHGFAVSPGGTTLNDQEAARALVDGLIGAAPGVLREVTQRAARTLLAASQDNEALNEDLRELRGALLARVIYRASPNLDAPLRAVAHLIKQGMILEPGELRQVLLSLFHLAYETAPRPETGPTNEQRSERADLRAAASALAAALYQQAQDEPPPTLVTWAEIGRSDSLPEVREPWK
ncbi:SIR2 family protein [Deinococcus sp. YIM 134068]|uniref:SIR2 family NAD-dependent protein deacylase n=1 Tax=Deinococcus lichenicola TaxID=3118910 RepID=UPI002F935594